MSKFLSHLSALLITISGLQAQSQTIDTWVTSQGAMFEASVKQVIPGQVTFILKDGREQPVPLADLSERSRTKLVESLGLGGTPVPVAATPAASATPAAPATPSTTTPAAPAPTATPMAVATAPADGAAIDVTDTAQVSARIGQAAILVGTVKEVINLGGAGHKLIKFDGSEFNVFISKQALDKSSDWILDDLPGKRLQVSGTLETYRDAPQIRGNTPSQLVRVQ
jgi:hypothetical protein